MDDVEVMCMQGGGYVDPHCEVSTCPNLHIGRIPVVPCLQSYL